MSSEKICGISVDNITYQSILEDVQECMEVKNSKMIITSINPQIIVEAGKYPEIIEFIENSSHRIPDGIGIVLISKLTGGKIASRTTGYDLMISLLNYADKHRKKVFFYGADANVLENMLSNIARDYPNLIIVGAIDGFTLMDNDDIVENINQNEPDFLFVALGFPKQELWLHNNHSLLKVKVLQDVGGSFDVISGVVKRAPDFYINNHLEWLYRSLSNPKRIGRIFQLPIFLIKSFLWKFKQ